MLLHIPGVLDADELRSIRNVIDGADWTDGRITAGMQSATVKNNLQLPESSNAARAAAAIVAGALNRSALFLSATLPRRIVPPLFNRYEGNANAFGNHVDNAVRTLGTGLHVRTDISATLFLAEPHSYDGGELVIEDGPGHPGAFGSTSPTRGPASAPRSSTTGHARSVKLPAGDLIIYPGSSVHRVEPVTRGARLASFFWVESMVRETERRQLLFDMDVAIMSLRQHGVEGDTSPAIVELTNCYHNLLRMWADV